MERHTFCRFTIINRKFDTTATVSHVQTEPTGESVRSTKIMRFLKPTKLGELSASWLKQDVLVDECVAKT